MSTNTHWYEELREAYRPKSIRILLIAESPPDPGDKERRFFYSPVLSRHDNLFRGVAQSLYGDSILDEREKNEILACICNDGFWMIDAVDFPIDKMSESNRSEAIRASAANLIDHCKELAPTLGVVICKPNVYCEVAVRLIRGGVPVLHEQPLPFPLYKGRKVFKDALREILKEHGVRTSCPK